MSLKWAQLMFEINTVLYKLVVQINQGYTYVTEG